MSSQDQNSGPKINDVYNHQFVSGAKRSADVNHLAYHLMCPTALHCLAATLAAGRDKYGEDNWTKGMPIADTLNHTLAHLMKYIGGDRTEAHLAHALCNLMFILHFEGNCDCHRGRDMMKEDDQTYLIKEMNHGQSATEPDAFNRDCDRESDPRDPSDGQAIDAYNPYAIGRDCGPSEPSVAGIGPGAPEDRYPANAPTRLRPDRPRYLDPNRRP